MTSLEALVQLFVAGFVSWTIGIFSGGKAAGCSEMRVTGALFAGPRAPRLAGPAVAPTHAPMAYS